MSLADSGLVFGRRKRSGEKLGSYEMAGLGRLRNKATSGKGVVTTVDRPEKNTLRTTVGFRTHYIANGHVQRHVGPTGCREYFGVPLDHLYWALYISIT